MAPALSCRLIGSGPVGLAFCLFALRAGIDRDCLAIDHARIAALAGEPSSAPTRPVIRRHLAISEGSRQLLDRIIAFPAAATIERIDVELAGHSGRTRIAAADFAVPALGHVVTHEALTRALARAVHDAYAGSAGPAADADVDLIVHAEGAIDEDVASRLDFGQSALLAEVSAPRRPDGEPATAYERFDRDGPLALLPIGLEAERFAMVWCDQAPINAERQQWPRERLNAALNQRFGDRLGELVIEGPVDLAPLARIRRRQAERGQAERGQAEQRQGEQRKDAQRQDERIDRAGAPAQVWIGNAAQMLHPVAGQGLNLGLRDAFELARLLGDVDEAAFISGQAGLAGTGDQAGTAPRLHGDLTRTLTLALARFERERQRDRGLLVGVTDSLARGFRFGGLHGLQSTLLTALDLLPALRRPLADTLLYGHRQQAGQS